MKKWTKASNPKHLRPTARPVEAPIDPFSDDEIRRFTRQRLIELAKDGGDTAAIRALTELLERAEPKSQPKEEQMTKAEALRICDIYEREFAGEYCSVCHRGAAQPE